MTTKENTQKNLSITISNGDERLGEIIHYENTGIIESWHYKTVFLNKTIDIALFAEKNLADAIHFAKTGTQPDNCIAYKPGKTTKF